MTRSSFKVMTALFVVTPCFSLVLPSAAAGIPEPGSLVVWLPAANGAVPPNAIIGGNEPGRTLPVCRAIYNKGVHPGKVVGKNCNFGYGGKELLAAQYDVLVGNPALLNKTPQLVRWIAAQGGQVPPGAFFGAYEPGRPILPICQAPYKGGVHVGKVVAGNCNFGYGGLEVLSPQYAVLVVGPVLPPTPVSQPQVGKVDIAISNTKASLIALQAEQIKTGKQSGLTAALASSIDKSVLGISNAEKLNNLAREIASQISQQAASESPSTAADAKATQSLTAAQEAELLNLNSRMMEIIREVLRLRQDYEQDSVNTNKGIARNL